MLIDERIYNQKNTRAKIGDFLVSEDGYVLMIVKDDNNDVYRLLRIKDGNPNYREGFESSLVNISYRSISSLMKDRDDYKLIPGELLKLTLVEE